MFVADDATFAFPPFPPPPVPALLLMLSRTAVPGTSSTVESAPDAGTARSNPPANARRAQSLRPSRVRSIIGTPLCLANATQRPCPIPDRLNADARGRGIPPTLRADGG